MILTLDFSSEVPIYIQIRNEMVQAIANGELADGDKLPTVRALALEVGINAMTVNKAYQLLKQEGYIITDRRNGATVSLKNKTAKKEQARLLLREKLKHIVAEAKLGGLTKEEIREEVENLYGE